MIIFSYTILIIEVLGCSVCQLILTLYANDLIEFLKKKHAPDTYKSL